MSKTKLDEKEMRYVVQAIPAGRACARMDGSLNESEHCIFLGRHYGGEFEALTGYYCKRYPEYTLGQKRVTAFGSYDVLKCDACIEEAEQIAQIKENCEAISPSRVMEWVGGLFGEGVAAGLEEGDEK